MTRKNFASFLRQPATGCCGSPPAACPRPRRFTIDNAPGSGGIPLYLIGTFTSFRRAMLDKVRQIDLLSGFSDPLAGADPARENDGDYQTIFIELWAYIADILTFYQERIAS